MAQCLLSVLPVKPVVLPSTVLFYFSTDELKAQFEADYGNCNLIEFLSHFSQPLPLRDHQLFRGSDTEDHVSSTEGGQFVQMVGWLLKRRLIIQVGI